MIQHTMSKHIISSQKKARSDDPILVHMLLYVLELRDDKFPDDPRFYIGVSYNLNTRLAQHTSGRGSQWTRWHRVVRVVEVRLHATLQMEREVTLRYMRKHGWRKVRGGPWSKAFMPRPPRDLNNSGPPLSGPPIPPRSAEAAPLVNHEPTPAPSSTAAARSTSVARSPPTATPPPPADRHPRGSGTSTRVIVCP